MSEQIVEYLYYPKNEELNNVKKTFKEVIAPFVKDYELQWERFEDKFTCQYDIVSYNESLHVTFRYVKSGRMGIREVCAFQNFLKEINIEASKAQLNSTTLLDTNSLFFSKKLLPYLHNYEWSLRKLIYLISPTYFPKNWIEKTIPKETILSMKRKQKGNYDSENLLQWMDLFDFEEYLFGENYINISGEDEDTIIRFKEITNQELINTFQSEKFTLSKPYSLWEEVFNKFVNIKSEEIQLDMQLIREGRNVVGHNKEITESVYQKLINKLKTYVKKLNDAFQKILNGNVNSNELSNMADDFEGYIEKQLNGIGLTGITKAAEAFSQSFTDQRTLYNTAGFTKAMENLNQPFASQRGLYSNTRLTKAAEAFSQSFADQRALYNTAGFTKAMENLNQPFASQRGLYNNMDLPTLKETSKLLSREIGNHHSKVADIVSHLEEKDND